MLGFDFVRSVTQLNIMKKLIRTAGFVLAGSLLLNGAAEAKCKFSFTVNLLALKTVDMGAPGFSMGDMTIMDADLLYKGKMVGTAVFNTQTDRMPDPSAANERRKLEQRLGIAQYHLSDTDSLVTIGEFLYTEPNSPQPYNLSQIRAVSGGTGKFKFARGQVTLRRIDSTTFQHDFELDVNSKLCNF